MQDMFACFVRPLLLVAGITCLCLMQTLTALAGPADGTYKIKTITNQFYDNGRPYKIPVKGLKKAMFNLDGIVVENNRIPIYQNHWFNALKNPQYRDALASLKITGPRKIRLSRINKGVFEGKSEKPLVANFSFVFLDQKLPIRIKSRARGNVRDNELVMNMKVRLILRDTSPAKEHYIIKGDIQIIAEKTNPTPLTEKPSPTT